MSDDVIPLSRFTALLQRPRGSKRLEALVDAPDAAARVAAMPVQDLYFLIKEVGLEEATDVVALATPEQVQGFLDLDAWERDRLDEKELIPWLEALLRTGEEHLGRVWRELDAELTALLFKRWIRVYNLAEEEVPDDEEGPFIPTPDRFFLLKVTDPDVAPLVEKLVDRLYRFDQVQARHTIRAAQSEPFAELEETAYRWRAGRMQDLGYSDYYEALEVYRPIDLASVAAGPPDPVPEATTLPAPLADKALKQGFLGRVLGRVVEPDEARRLETALATLFNRVLSADRINPGDPEAAAAGAARAGGTLSVGLETVARGDVERGLEALRAISLTRLHRAGYTVTFQLAQLARVLGRRIARAEEPYASIVTALLTGRPSFAQILDDQPKAGTRPFSSVDDVRRTARALGVLADQAKLVCDWAGIDPSAQPPQVSLGDLGRTLLVHLALGHKPSAAPLTQADLTALRALPDVRAAVLAALPKEFAGAIDGWMSDLTPALKGEEARFTGLILE